MSRFLQAASILFVVASLSPAAAQAPVRGDPAIDAQWAYQLRGAPPPAGPATSVNLYGRTQFRELPRGYVVVPDWYRQPRGQRYAPPGYRPMPGQAMPRGYRTLPREAVPRSYRTVRAPAPAPAPRRAFDPAYLPAVVDYETTRAPGTIVVDPARRYLYLVEEGGKARRYGIGVGRDGFGWSGEVKVGRKAEWPTWTPPAEMRKRQPDLPISMAGGPNNPLGARAIYLYEGGRDTLFRIHGSNEPWTIGQAVSSGCFRMRNEDVTDLYERVRVGAKVVVL